MKKSHFKFPKLNVSAQLLIVVVVSLLWGDKLFSENVQSALYAISLNLKGLLLFVLPFIIFSCLFSCLLTFRGKKAIGFMLLLFLAVSLSNLTSTFIAYGIGSLELINIETTLQTIQTEKALMPLWHFEFPQWIPNDYALYLGFFAGALFSFFPNKRAYQFSEQAKRWVTLFLEKVFLPTLPIFALGFILKMENDGLLTQVIESYLPLLLIIVVTYIAYLALLFLLAANFNFKQWLYYIKNVWPVALMGFSTMSSLATMPMTIKAAEKNTNNIELARAIIPATVNIHLIGVSIAIPLMAICILLNFGYQFPSLSVYFVFALYFVIAQFAIAAVPGGGILVMLPLLETHLGFSADMSALITALYILFDPAVTITNVLGNSALVIIVSKIFAKLHTKVSNN